MTNFLRSKTYIPHIKLDSSLLMSISTVVSGLKMNKIEAVFFATLMCTGLYMLTACGNDAMSSGGVAVQLLTAPDGRQCYAIVQDGAVKGGNCL